MYILPDLKGVEIIKYLRKSRADDPLLTVEEVLEKHEQMLNEWMEKHLPDAGAVPEENCLREVVSGETLDSRPKMQALLRLIESPDKKAILCKEPQRLSRGDMMDIGYLVKVLRYTNTLVITLQYTYDLRDDRDRELFERELMRGNEYLEYQKRIMNDGKLLAVKNGNYIARLAPFGYKKVEYKEGKHTCRTLEPHPEEAPAVKRIFELYRSGMGSVRICEQLEKEHYLPRYGGKWSPSTVRAILKNEHYIGKVKWDQRPHVQQVEEGEIKTRRLTAEDYLVFDGKHPAIIDQETWDAVQALNGKIPKNKIDAELKNPLSGLLRCACGRMMTYKTIKRHGRVVAAPRYLCGDSRGCENGSAIAEEVLAEVSKALKDCIEDFEVRIEGGADNSAELHKQLVARLEKRLHDLRELEVKQWDEKTKGGMPDHVFARLNTQTVEEIAEVTQALCDAQGSAPQHVDLHEKVTTFKKALELLHDPDAPVKELNQLLRACIEEITYSRPGKLQERGGANRVNPAPFRLDVSLRV